MPIIFAYFTFGKWARCPYKAHTNPFAIIELYGNNGRLPTDLVRDTWRIVDSGAKEHSMFVQGASWLHASNHFGGCFCLTATDFSFVDDAVIVAVFLGSSDVDTAKPHLQRISTAMIMLIRAFITAILGKRRSWEKNGRQSAQVELTAASSTQEIFADAYTSIWVSSSSLE